MHEKTGKQDGNKFGKRRSTATAGSRIPANSLEDEHSWDNNLELFKIGLNESGFSVFCLFGVRLVRDSKVPPARLYANNIGERYGLFEKQIRKKLVAAPSYEVPSISEMFQDRSSRLWLYYNAHDRRRAEFFRIPVQFGFPKFKAILVVPFRGRAYDGLCMAYSTRLPRKQDVDDALEHILDWQAFLSKRKARSASAPRVSGKPDVKPDILCEIELECLKWAAAGKTLRDISEITGLSYKSVRYNLEKARDKYGFSSMNQTLVQATIDYNLSPYGDNGDSPGD